MAEKHHHIVYRHLCEVFGTYSGNLLGKTFANSSKLLLDASFWVYDHDPKNTICNFVRKEKAKSDCYQIINNNTNADEGIYVVCFDGCLFSGKIGQRGDNLLFNSTHFFFVEAKVNVENAQSLDVHLTKAKEQLKTQLDTIQNRLLEYGYGMKGLQKVAIVVMPRSIRPNTLIKGKIKNWAKDLGVTKVELVQGSLDLANFT